MPPINELNELRLAVLIDADNVPRNCIKAVMEEIAIYGTPTIKRIYGDWTSPNIGGWKTALLENAITPIQQYGYTVGKNSTDSAMIIDAMDILYSGRTDGFCIVSSDSDFTRLAIRLREAGMKVIGIGEKKTPNPFIVACDKFIYIEVIRDAAQKAAEAAARAARPAPKPEPKTEPKAEPKSDSKPEKQSDKKQRSRPKAQEAEKAPEIEKSPEKSPEKKPESDKNGVPAEVIALLAQSVSDIADDDGWAFMGELGNLLLKKQPDFDPRNFGFSKLTPLIASIGRFEIDVRQTADWHIKHIYLRDKEGNS